MEPVAGLLADEAHELVRVAEVADVGAAGRQVAAQRDEVPDAVAAVLREHVADALARRADAREVRRAVHAFGADLEHRRERAFARRAAGAEGHRAERGLQLRELRGAPRAASPTPSGVFGGKNSRL